MDKIIIRGGHALTGDIKISGAKNAALPLMAAALLTDKTLTLLNLPKLADISSMAALLARHGVQLHLNGLDYEGGGHTGKVLEMTAPTITSTTAPYDLVRKMRASVLVLGPLLARCGQAKVSLPGGCAIGNRPVDLHLSAMEALGAEIDLAEGYVYAKAPQGLRGGKILFHQVSVGATENAVMAACLARGETLIANAAREPEVVDLCDCLIAMGAGIDGVGTDTLKIQGKEALQGATHPVVPDRIEIGTYAVAAAITGGDLTLTGARRDLVESVVNALSKAGAEIFETETGLRIKAPKGRLQGIDVRTEPYPGFPTDMQAQFMALLSVAEGASMITETIFENRFMHVPEMKRMGANVNVQGRSAIVRGTEHLSGAQVMATDLRASVSLVLAGLAATGETVINRVYHLDRGYELLEEKLAACGADIQRVNA